jgi:hypothetical protein
VEVDAIIVTSLNNEDPPEFELFQLSSAEGYFNGRSDGPGSIRIFDVNGKLVEAINTPGGPVSFQLHRSGVYFVAFTGENSYNLLKVISLSGN